MARTWDVRKPSVLPCLLYRASIFGYITPKLCAGARVCAPPGEGSSERIMGNIASGLTDRAQLLAFAVSADRARVTELTKVMRVPRSSTLWPWLSPDVVAHMVEVAPVAALPVLVQLDRRCNQLASSRLRPIAIMTQPPFTVDVKELLSGLDLCNRVFIPPTSNYTHSDVMRFIEACAAGAFDSTTMLEFPPLSNTSLQALAIAFTPGADKPRGRGALHNVSCLGELTGSFSELSVLNLIKSIKSGGLPKVDSIYIPGSSQALGEFTTVVRDALCRRWLDGGHFFVKNQFNLINMDLSHMNWTDADITCFADSFEFAIIHGAFPSFRPINSCYGIEVYVDAVHAQNERLRTVCKRFDAKIDSD